MNRRTVFALSVVALLPLGPIMAAEPTLPKAQTIQGNTQFALDYYQLMTQQKGNLFFSPLSISSAFGMTSLGANGDTLKEIDQTLHFIGGEEGHRNFAALLNHLNGDGKTAKERGYQLSVANALWGQEKYPWEKTFLTESQQFYGAGLRQVNFKGDPQGSRKIVNDWVEAETQGKIKDLIPSSAVTPLTRLILTNAIYFKGDWALKFDPKRTKEDAFWISAKDSVKVPMMHQKHHYNYCETADIQVVELPYKNDELSMVVLLPKAKDGLAAMEKSLSTELLADVTTRLRHRGEVDVTLPKFKIESEADLSGDLIQLGMKKAFAPGVADFSGLNGVKGDLYISAAVHKAFVEVNEEGTEAAAATAIIVATRSVQITPTFKADHPFVFIIRDKSTNAILFMGRVAKP